jgi:hypothetical protein
VAVLTAGELRTVFAEPVRIAWASSDCPAVGVQCRAGLAGHGRGCNG